MPKTRVERIVFTLMMVFCMVFCMTCYTVARNTGGMSYRVLYSAIQEMWLEYVVVFLLVFFVVSHLAPKLALRIIDSRTDRPIFMVLAIQCFTVCMVVPTITLFATFVHGGFTADWLPRWIQLAASCFPVALLLQVFYIGPLVRLVFRLLFVRKKQQ